MTDVPALPDHVGEMDRELFGPVFVDLVEPVVARIRTDVPAYAGPDDGRRHQLITLAVSSAVRAYLHAGQGRNDSLRKANELFLRMGWGEAQDGHDTANLERALDVAVRIAWHHLADRAVSADAPSADLQSVITTLLTFADHLRATLLSGHATGTRHPLGDEDLRRGKLFQFLQNNSAGRISPGRPLGADLATIGRMARAAQWPLPEQVCVLGMAFPDGDPRLPDRPDLLQRIEEGRLLVVAPAEVAAEVAAEMQRGNAEACVVTGWSVPVTEAGSGIIWTLRALDLLDLDMLPRAPLVRCEDHISQLWLHSEPSMRRRLCQELLVPLLAESQNSREILSETLLIWLETRDSAPAIAARLDVHPQTVRYRWRRINELFGEALHEPEFVVQMTLVLKASVPLWKSGDQSDFELFRDNQENEQ